uniref:Uncharacterized protein n=1 Tax=Pristionchus pacificus TaxID=54126 RepID=A0A2A6BI30_PRIPA|eukprot:PDM65486.1 hypothetical protein PRIPAC_52428 [Pristionchus pacificus]
MFSSTAAAAAGGGAWSAAATAAAMAAPLLQQPEGAAPSERLNSDLFSVASFARSPTRFSEPWICNKIN